MTLQNRTFQDKPCLKHLIEDGFRSTGIRNGNSELFKKGTYRVSYNHQLDIEEFGYEIGKINEIQVWNDIGDEE